MKRINGKLLTFIFVCLLISRFIMYVMFVIYYHMTDVSLFLEEMNYWDARWYMNYAAMFRGEASGMVLENTGQPWWAFFPLYPLLLWGMSFFTNGVNYLTGSILGAILSCIAVYFACQYILETRCDMRTAYLYVFFFFFGPYSFYFTITFSESLFLLLFVLALYALRRQRYMAMGVWGALLSATRSTGVLFVFVVLAHRITLYLEDTEKGSRHLGGFLIGCIKDARLVLGTMLIPLGMFLYMLGLHLWLGDGFGFLHAQSAWTRYLDWNFYEYFYRSIFHLMPMNDFTYILWVIIITAGLLFWKLMQGDHTESAFPVILFLVALQGGNLSIARYMAGCFIPLLAFTDFCMRRRRAYRVVLCVVAVIVELMLIREWYGGSVYLV